MFKKVEQIKKKRKNELDKKNRTNLDTIVCHHCLLKKRKNELFKQNLTQ